MSNETILIVAGDPEVAHQIRDALSREGFGTVAIEEAAAALKATREELPEAVVIDAVMHGAYEVCRLIKSDDRLVHVPVIFIHDNPEIEDTLAGFEAGAHDFIPIPFRPEEFTARIAAAVRVKQNHESLKERNAKLETLVKQVRTAVQHFEQPRAGASAKRFPSGASADGKANVRLTKRELEILQMLARGLSNEAISKQLYISPTTARNHIQNILGKMGVHSKLEAVAYAVRAGYVDFVT